MINRPLTIQTTGTRLPPHFQHHPSQSQQKCFILTAAFIWYTDKRGIRTRSVIALAVCPIKVWFRGYLREVSNILNTVPFSYIWEILMGYSKGKYLCFNELISRVHGYKWIRPFDITVPYSTIHTPASHGSGDYLKVINPSPPQPLDKWQPFPRRNFQLHFHEWRFLYLNSNFTEVCSLG